MLQSVCTRLLRLLRRPRPTIRTTPLCLSLQRQPQLEGLERRINFATAVFAGGILTVTGDPTADVLVVVRDTAGTLFVTDDGATLAITGGPATVANTTRVVVNGLGGD